MVHTILYLRQQYHFGPGKIADYLKRCHQVSVARSCVHRILGVCGLAFPRRADLPETHSRERRLPPIVLMECSADARVGLLRYEVSPSGTTRGPSNTPAVDGRPPSRRRMPVHDPRWRLCDCAVPDSADARDRVAGVCR